MHHTRHTTHFALFSAPCGLSAVLIPPFGPCPRSIPEEDIMTMDLIMEPSKPMKSKNFQWWCKEGIVANLDKVPSRSSPRAGMVRGI